MSDAAQVQVMNVTLNALGAEPVTDLTDASVKRSGGLAKALRMADLARQSVLCRNGWHCALEYTNLTPEPSPPDNWKFPYQYRLPGGALQVWEVEGIAIWLTDRALWGGRWQTAAIDSDLGAVKAVRGACSIAPLPISYIRDCSWGALTKPLILAVGLQLAADVSLSYDGDQQAADKRLKKAEAAIQLAIGADGTQASADVLAPSTPELLRRRCW